MGERVDSHEDAVYAPPVAEGEAPREPEGAQGASGPTFVPEARLSLAARLAITLGAGLAPFALERVPLPGVDDGLVRETFGINSPVAVSAGALGLLPVISSYALVEMAALLVPSLRRARHAGPDGRSKLHRIVALVALLLAVFQAYGIDAMLRNESLAGAGTATRLLTMTAGTFLLWGAAQLVTRHGLGNGVVWLTSVSVLRSAVVLFAVPATGLRGSLRSPHSTGAVVAAAVAMVVATVLVLRSSSARVESVAAGGERAPSDSQARPMALPAPSSGLGPSAMAGSLIMLPATLAALGVPGMQLGRLGDTTALIATVVLSAAMAVTLGFLFHRPERVAALLGRARVDLTPAGAGGASALVWRSMPATIGYVVGLSCLATLGVTAVVWSLPLLTAWVMDAVVAHRARRAHADLVTVWTDERPFAAVVAQAALRHRGIEGIAVGLAQRALLQFGAGYVPIELRVPAADARRAHKLLSTALPEPTTAAPSETTTKKTKQKTTTKQKTKQRPPLPVALAPLSRAAVGVIAIAVVLVGLVVFVNATRPGPPGPPTAEALAARGKVLQLLRVEDDVDPLEAIEGAGGYPAGVRLEKEDAPIGPGKTVTRRFVRTILQGGETLDALEARMRPWLDAIAVPAGTHFALGEYTELDFDTSAPVVVGLRTYLVRDAPLLTGADVLSALAFPEERGAGEEWLVSVDLTEEGGERFRQATAANVKRRMAIVVRGRAMSVPVVQQEIRGGHVVITMGAKPSDQQRAEALDLARTLTAP